MIKLAKCDVDFNQEAHTYNLNGKQLSGVTGIIKWMFPETYSYVPMDVLQKAAERGSFIHENIEIADGLGVTTDKCQEAQEYVKLRDEWGLKALANEYLVTDGENIASSIDIVFDDLTLADIKCTSKIHDDNVRLQLSIYAYLFEKMNKRKKAKRLVVIWLPKEQYGKPCIKELERIPSKDVKKIIDAYIKGESNEPFRELFQPTKEIQVVSKDLVLQIDLIERQVKQLQEKQKSLRETLRAAMELNGVTKWETDKFKVSLGADYISKKFDTTKFKEENPALYDKYVTETNTKGRFDFKLK